MMYTNKQCISPRREENDKSKRVLCVCICVCVPRQARAWNSPSRELESIANERDKFMALKIRLARGGAKKRPFYRIVVAEASAPRDGRYVERVGTYNPMVPKEHEQRMTLNSERITFWLGQGAKPTDRVHKMLAAAGLAEAPVIRDQPKKISTG